MDEPPISRGFRSRREQQVLKNRVPPGQYVTTDFPVLSAGPTPQIKLENWSLTSCCSAESLTGVEALKVTTAAVGD